MPIANLPADGDVRNTRLFRSVAPKLRNISVNKFIFELMRVVEDAERHPEKHKFYQNDQQGMSATSVMDLCEWVTTPQNQEGIRFWHEVFQEETAWREAARRGGW